MSVTSAPVLCIQNTVKYTHATSVAQMHSIFIQNGFFVWKFNVSAHTFTAYYKEG